MSERLTSEREAEIREFHLKVHNQQCEYCDACTVLTELDAIRAENKELRTALAEIIMDPDCHCTQCDIARAALEKTK